jgi:hypothetical protein
MKSHIATTFAPVTESRPMSLTDRMIFGQAVPSALRPTILQMRLESVGAAVETSQLGNIVVFAHHI